MFENGRASDVAIVQPPLGVGGMYSELTPNLISGGPGPPYDKRNYERKRDLVPQSKDRYSQRLSWMDVQSDEDYEEFNKRIMLERIRIEESGNGLSPPNRDQTPKLRRNEPSIVSPNRERPQ